MECFFLYKRNIKLVVFSSTSFHENHLIYETLPQTSEQQNISLQSRVCGILGNCFYLVSETDKSGFLASLFCLVFFQLDSPGLNVNKSQFIM